MRQKHRMKIETLSPICLSFSRSTSYGVFISQLIRFASKIVIQLVEKIIYDPNSSIRLKV